MASKKKVRLTDENNPLNSTESVLASFENLSVGASNASDNPQQSDPLEESKSETSTSTVINQAKINNKSTSQQVENISEAKLATIELKKATFKIDSTVLESLDRYHLELQLNLGRKKAPYKETIVEFALKSILEEASSNPDALLESLQKQQDQRAS